ncbi:MAG: hypothetical protein Sapg2KO_31870 [Saprospiraceae bacterium]
MFGIFKRKKEGTPEINWRNYITSIYKQTDSVWSPNELKGIDEYESLKKLPEAQIKELILQLLDHYIEVLLKKKPLKANYRYAKNNYYHFADNIMDAILNGLLRRKLNYSEEEWMALFEKYRLLNETVDKSTDIYSRFNYMPVNHSIKQIEYYLKGNPLSQKLKDYIKKMLQWNEFKNVEHKYYYGSDLKKAVKKLQLIIQDPNEKYTFKLKANDIGAPINEEIQRIKKYQDNFYKIFYLASGVSSSKPSAKFKKELSSHLEIIGLNNYKKTVHKLLKIPLGHQSHSITTTYGEPGHTYEYTESYFLCSPSQNFIKGLVWTCYRFSDKETIALLTRLAEKCYTKIPGKGPAAASIGNACVYILGNMKGKDGLGALSRLKLKVRQNNVKKTIDKYLVEGAEKYDVSVEELKEMAVPDYDLKLGSKQINFGDYTLKIAVDSSSIQQQWIKPDGAPIKSVPAVVKNTATLKKKLQTVRKELKEIQKVFSAQKQRIDNQFILDRVWTYASFKEYYLDHGLVYPIATKLIWTFTRGEKSVDAVFLNQEWRSLEGVLVDWLNDQTKVQLWHPIHANEAIVVGWRRKMMDLQWKQPIKQAYRELYLLTDAEINTKTYSNRMAAHILKQHQFNSLANLRNWKYSLMGAYDDGRYNEVCSKKLPEYGITAEFWIDELNQDDAFNDTGIWLYITTDQVKFKNANEETLDLIDVPSIVFTEIMRDVDLFVGVCSVGNDPQWLDNSGERQTNRDYWESYSFGDLNEIAKTRKEILQNLLPRLKKIRDKAKIEGKFLIVKGQLRTYKIHIGSSNILMEPNDQYLCIVPARTTKTSANSVFVPFEGDRGLSIVLSKAFLLAEDDKIKDTTIISQINRGLGG